MLHMYMCDYLSTSQLLNSEAYNKHDGTARMKCLSFVLFSNLFTVQLSTCALLCLVALLQTENKANSIVHAVKDHVKYTNEVSGYVCHHS